MNIHLRRRELIVGGAGLILAGGARGHQPPTPRTPRMVVTPPQIEGPFYPYEAPREIDSDLVRLSTNDAPAIGQVVHFTGKLQNIWGRPIGNATVELWQADARGKYRHPDDAPPPARDPRFQGFGRVVTDASGDFRFRTIRPVAYAFGARPEDRRAPHFHLAVSTRGTRRLTTQLYIEGEPLNETDLWLHMVADAAQRRSLIRPLQDGSAIERNAKRIHYDIVMVA
jgi:protocatechuate 3,4-dioxygenase beta subunit